MASKFLLSLLLLLFTLSTAKSSVVHVGMISKALSDNGYNAMALTLEMTLRTLIPSNTSSSSSFTVFCPPDKAFFTSKYSQPPITLLQYHVVPSKLDSEAIQSSSLSHGARVETLLHGHPLVVTTLPDTGKYTMNDVQITNWEIYNDGFMVVHGVKDFFDPAYQTLLYPWYDGEISRKGDSGTDLGVKGVSEDDASGSSSWVMMKSNLLLILAGVAIASVFLWLVLEFILCCRDFRRADGYIYVE